MLEPTPMVDHTSETETASGRRKVLVVDDSLIMRKQVSEIVAADPDLEVVDTAENGKIALQKVRVHKPDVVLLDIEMPEMSGLETLRRLGLRFPGKVIILSSLVGEGDSAERAEALRLGAAATIGKPSGSVSLDIKERRGSEVVRTIRKVLGMPEPVEAEAAPAQAAQATVAPAPVPAPAASAHNPGPWSATLQQALFTNMGEGLLVFDSAGRLTGFNAKAAELLRLPGLGREQAALDQVFNEYNEGIAETIREVSSTGASRPAEDNDYSDEAGDWIPLRMTMYALPETAGTFSTMVMLTDAARERQLREMLEKTMSRSLANEVINSGAQALGGQSRRVTVLFSDIRSFTSISEQLGAARTVELLNQFFSYMADVIQGFGGVIDKFIGDAIMAVFDGRDSKLNGAASAIQAACSMLRAVEMFNEQRAEGPVIKIGIGLATGDVIAGNVGSPNRMNYTVIGDAVNLAARLESLTKPYGMALLADDATIEASGQAARCRRIDMVRVMGQKKPIALHEVAMVEHPEASWNTALDGILAPYFAGQWLLAEQAALHQLSLQPEDATAKRVLARSRQRKAMGDAPWDGVWTLTEK